MCILCDDRFILVSLFTLTVCSTIKFKKDDTLNIKNIPGFPELTPDKQLVMDDFINSLKRTFNLYSYSAIDTPVAERNEVFELEKGRDLFESYSIYTLKKMREEERPDSTDGNISLRYDLTVPLARYVSQHKENIIFPFRRYHIAPVWRGELPDENHFRQFYQADFDIIGDSEINAEHDAEILQLAVDLFKSTALGRAKVKISNRKILRGIFRYYGCAEDDLHWAIGVIDDFKEENLTLSVSQLNNLLSITEVATHQLLSSLVKGRNTEESLAFLNSLEIDDEEFTQGVNELMELVEFLSCRGMTSLDFKVDLTIARSHDYYTGMIFETELLKFKEMGSVCSGGRYDNLTSTLSDHNLPGVGASIGVSRLILSLLKAGFFLSSSSTPGIAFIASNGTENKKNQHKIATMLRTGNINTEVSYQSKTVLHQINYAGTKGFKYALIPDGQWVRYVDLNGKRQPEDKHPLIPLNDSFLQTLEHMHANA